MPKKIEWNLNLFATMLVFSIAFSAFVGNMEHIVYLTTWTGSIGMAMNTSICFMLVGVVLFFLVRNAKKS